MTNTTEQIRIIKSEWHQVEKRYAMVVTRDDVEQIYGEDEAEERWQDLINGELDPQDMIRQGEDENYYIDWDWLDEDDWWTDRKGGYEVTYEVEEDYVEPMTDREIIENLKLEVNALHAELQRDKKYTDVMTEDERAQRLAELKAEFERLTEDDSDH
jgi:hypothetical protein